MIDVETPDGVADCYLTRPDDDAAHPGVLFVIDAIGLRPQINKMADRIAAQGYVVLAPNIFYRAGRAPLWPDMNLADPDARAEFFKTIGPLAKALTPEAMASDGRAYLGMLAELTEGKVGITGYCMGGRHGWQIAASYPDRVAALGGFHTGGMVTEADDSPHLRAPEVTAAVYWGHADNDQGMTPENVAPSTRRWMKPASPTPPRSIPGRCTATRWPTRAPTTRKRPSATSPRCSTCSDARSSFGLTTLHDRLPDGAPAARCRGVVTAGR